MPYFLLGFWGRIVVQQQTFWGSAEWRNSFHNLIKETRKDCLSGLCTSARHKTYSLSLSHTHKDRERNIDRGGVKTDKYRSFAHTTRTAKLFQLAGRKNLSKSAHELIFSFSAFSLFSSCYALLTEVAWQLWVNPSHVLSRKERDVINSYSCGLVPLARE